MADFLIWGQILIQAISRKYIGYKGFTEVAASSNDYLAVRRFDELHVRTILRLQAHLSKLEEELREKDDELSSREADDIHNGVFYGDPSNERVEILIKTQHTLEQYGQ